MKILAIRGCNLASLKGTFEVDLTQDALARPGLFAVTGPTGSGKSTILDAACLALFDTTPRVHAGNTVRPGRDDDDEGVRLTGKDPRTILRRGAGEGWAEVDFVGRDGHPYRSRWSVRRARGQAVGRFQNQSLGLVRLDTGQALGGTRTETLAEIERLLGLSFHQFRRSALLAQGDFAAFLRASADERSELLERISGTRIYTDVSRAAYQRARAEQVTLDTLLARADEVGVLPDTDRAALEARAAELAGERENSQKNVQSCRAAVDWHAAHGRLAQDLAAGTDALRGAEERWRAADPDRHELARVDEVQPLRPLVDAADRTAAEGSRAATELDRKRDAARLAQAGRQAAEATLEAAQAAQARAAARERELREPLARAGALDALVAAARTAREQAAATVDHLARQHQALAEAMDALSHQRAAVDDRAREAAEWLQDHAAVAPVAGQWERWREALDQFVRAKAAVARLDAQSGAVTDADDAARDKLAAARGDFAAAEAAQQQAQEAWRAAQEALRAVDAEALVEQARALDRQAGVLDQLADLARQAHDTRGRIARQQDEARQAREQAAQAATGAAAASPEIGRLATQIDEAGRAFLAARAALDLAGRRADLRHGQPCPLCGATDHPWAHEGAPGERIADELARRLVELRALHAQALRDEQAWQAQAAAAADRLARATEAETQDAALLDLLARRWAALARDLAAAPAPFGALDDARTALVAARERVAAARRAHADRQRQVDTLADTRDRTAQVLEAARDALDAATRAASAATEALAHHHRQLQVHHERRQEAHARLAQPLAPWAADLDDDPAALARELQDLVATWTTREADLTRARSDRERLDRSLAADQARRDAAAQRLAEAQVDLASSGDQLTRVSQQRQALLGGRPTDEVRRELDQALEAAARALDLAREQAQAATTAAVAAGAAADTAQEALAAAQAARDQAQARLTTALAGRDPTDVRALLAREPGWLAARRAALRELDDTLAAARTRLAERQARLDAHLAAGVPDLEAQPAAHALAAAEATLREATDHLALHRARLRQDDEARQRALHLAQEVAAQRAVVEHWELMNRLVGSADGKKLRVFAQSLTLEALLAQANHHLADLAPRYRLMRVPGQDLDLQVVDRDMGDEVRGVGSLSGGESFLVSLALALGLASLASRDTRVETLFIDEGFGTLDNRTLEVALATLDQLQASGRQVGVISHVPGLADRIGAQVRVVPLGGGASRVEVDGG